MTLFIPCLRVGFSASSCSQISHWNMKQLMKDYIAFDEGRHYRHKDTRAGDLRYIERQS